MNSKMMHAQETDRKSGRFDLLVQWGLLTREELLAAVQAAKARGIDLERVLLNEFGVPKKLLLNALSEFFACPPVEYDERMPIPPELLAGLDSERLSLSGWFPVSRDNDTVIIAARNPHDQAMFDEVRRSIKAGRYEFRVTLDSDIQWFIQDYLLAKPGQIIGTERTGLAYWRNTMAHWRTRLSCYRNDLAKGRTDLAFLRWGLGLLTLSNVLMRTRTQSPVMLLIWLMIAAGLVFGVFGLDGYLKVRRTRMQTPGHFTLVEVTAATLHFLERYHDLDQCSLKKTTKTTMLARLGDCIGNYSTILYPQPASRERTHLARERNVLAAQRTIAACYRTLYARARTGLAFIRTGVSFLSIGIALAGYFAFSWLTILDVILISAGLLMAIDGLLWYLPVRKEQAEMPRCGV
jgi:uncharacterized membrane protein YidH (DUF202 family)